jgi:dihydrodipicolinate reductase
LWVKAACCLLVSGERLELTHRVQPRSAFAQGAIRAGHWPADKKPGLYARRAGNVRMQN